VGAQAETSLGGSRRKPRGRLLLAGCVILTAIAACTLAVGALSLGRLRETGFLLDISRGAQSAVSEMESMARLREELLTSYPSQEIGVGAHARVGAGSSSTTRVLRVEFINPEFAADDPRAGTMALARDIAIHVGSLYPGIDRFQLIEIRITTRVGTGFTLSEGVSYAFNVADLINLPDPESEGGA